MKITNVSTTVLHYPEGRPIQDATIPPPPDGAVGRSQLFVHIETDEPYEGLGIGQASPIPDARRLGQVCRYLWSPFP